MSLSRQSYHETSVTLSAQYLPVTAWNKRHLQLSSYSGEIGVADIPLCKSVAFGHAIFPVSVKFKLMFGGCGERAVQSNQSKGRKRYNKQRRDKSKQDRVRPKREGKDRPEKDRTGETRRGKTNVAR